MNLKKYLVLLLVGGFSCGVSAMENEELLTELLQSKAVVIPAHWGEVEALVPMELEAGTKGWATVHSRKDDYEFGGILYHRPDQKYHIVCDGFRTYEVAENQIAFVEGDDYPEVCLFAYGKLFKVDLPTASPEFYITLTKDSRKYGVVSVSAGRDAEPLEFDFNNLV